MFGVLWLLFLLVRKLFFSGECVCVGPLIYHCFRPPPLCVSFIDVDPVLFVSDASSSSQFVSDASTISPIVSVASSCPPLVSAANLNSRIIPVSQVVPVFRPYSDPAFVPNPATLVFPFLRGVHVDTVNNVFSISPAVPVPALLDFPLVTEVLRHFHGCNAVSAIFESRCCEVLSDGPVGSLNVDGVVAGIAISAMRACFAAQVVSMSVHPMLPGLPIIVPDVPDVPGVPDVLRASSVGFRRRRRHVVSQHRFRFYHGSGPLRFSRRLVGRGPLHRRA